MDAHRFDALTRALSTASRRGLLGTLLALPVLGGLLAFLGADEVDAKGRRKRRKKRHKHGKGNGRHRKGRRNRTCKRKSHAKICAGKCGIVKNRKTCKKKIDCGACGCAAGNCRGCCAGDGTCQPGTSPQACGRDAETCQVCGESQLCVEGACRDCDVCASGCLYGSVKAAVADDAGPQTIVICPGTYQETFIIGRSLTLLGFGQGDDPLLDTILDGNGSAPVVSVGAAVPDVFLENLRITGGVNAGGDGGGVYNAGEVTLNDCTVTGNSARDDVRSIFGTGGGIYNSSGGATLNGCTVSVNSAISGGGIFIERGDMTLIDCTVSGNTAFEGFGGGLFNQGNGNVTLTDCTVSGNVADDNGGGILSRGLLTLTDTTVNGNRATSGGGIYNDTRRNEPSEVSLDSTSHVCDNEPDQCVGFSAPSGVCTEDCPA